MKKGKRDAPGDRHVRILHEWILSAAWRTLKARDVWALVHLIDGWKGNGSFTLPSNAVRWACTWGALRRALDNLIEAGFIDRAFKGGLKVGTKNGQDVYRLSDRWRARSVALMLDDAQGQAQGTLGWMPTRKPRRSAAVQHLKQAQGKLPLKRQRRRSGRPRSQTDNIPMKMKRSGEDEDKE